MIIYLIQHGDAIQEEKDTLRNLSEKGISQIKRTAEFLRKLSLYPDIILHSDKKRSMESAEIISAAMGSIKHEMRTCLNPGDDISIIKAELDSSDKSIMIVGHMPFLGRLCYSLLSSQFIDITNGSPIIIKKYGKSYLLDTYIKNDYLSS